MTCVYAQGKTYLKIPSGNGKIQFERFLGKKVTNYLHERIFICTFAAD